MKNIMNFKGHLNEAQGAYVTATIENYEFTYKGSDFTATFEVSGNVSYEQPTREEGHGIHMIGGGPQVENIEVELIFLEIPVIGKIATITGSSENKEIFEEIQNFLSVDKDSSKEIEEVLIEAWSERE
jgi:hypothetical protein